MSIAESRLPIHAAGPVFGPADRLMDVSSIVMIQWGLQILRGAVVRFNRRRYSACLVVAGVRNDRWVM